MCVLLCVFGPGTCTHAQFFLGSQAMMFVFVSNVCAQAPMDANLNWSFLENALQAMTPSGWSKIDVQVCLVHGCDCG